MDFDGTNMTGIFFDSLLVLADSYGIQYRNKRSGEKVARIIGSLLIMSDSYPFPSISLRRGIWGYQQYGGDDYCVLDYGVHFERS